jgi:hypothetical protein
MLGHIALYRLEMVEHLVELPIVGCRRSRV